MQTAGLEFAEVKKFRFDAPIVASDGEAGRLAAIVADAERRSITHAVVKVGFLGLGGTYYIPLDLVTDASKDVVNLSVTLDDIKQKLKAQPQGVTLTSGTTVAAGGKGLGHLTQVTINAETQELRHLVVARGLGREVLVLASGITSISAKQISVDLRATKPDQLTPFRPDAELRDAIYQAIFNYDPLRIDLPAMEIHAIDGSVWLKGHVSSDLNRRLAQDQLSNIEGLAEMHNELVADTDLASAVSFALAKDPRTAEQHIGVYPRLGEVRLRGAVRTPEARQAALEIARAVPGVGSVINELHVDPTATVVPVLAGVTNTEDDVPGGR